MGKLVVWVLCCVSLIGNAQEDTIRVMHYNLLNYGNYTSYCTSLNNNIDNKDDYLITILDYVKPDVFTVNELGIDFVGLENQNAIRILDNTLNINGVTKYQKAAYTGNGYTVNMMYYNSEKLVFHKQETIANGLHSGTLVRSVDFYTLYHKDPNLASHNDTVFITFVVAHLKAGSNQSDRNERANAALDIMEFIENNNVGRENRLLCGDLNLKGDTSRTFPTFTAYPVEGVRFSDPIDKPGYWAGDWQFKDIHSQSTRDFSANGDCPAGGGLDDRFDLILATQPILWGEMGVSYIPNSYNAIGNDGTSFNSDLNTITNTGVPQSVATALFNMSDHLPIVMDIRVSKDIVNGIYQAKIESLNVEFNNPVKSELVVRVPNNVEVKQIVLYDIEGRIVYVNSSTSTTQFIIDTESLNAGLYLLNVQTIAGKQGNYKVVKY